MNIITKVKNLFKRAPKVVHIEDSVRISDQTKQTYIEIGLNALIACECDEFTHYSQNQTITYNRREMIHYLFTYPDRIKHHWESKPGRQIFLMYVDSWTEHLLTIKDIVK